MRVIDPKVLRRKTGRGWRLESTRHALSARGIKTSGLSPSKLSTARVIVLQERQRQVNLRRENKPKVSVLVQYLNFKRTRKGMGRLYSINDVRNINQEIIRSGDKHSIKRAADLMNKIEAYEASGFRPRIQPTKLERTKVRALRKLEANKRLTVPEKKSLLRARVL